MFTTYAYYRLLQRVCTSKDQEALNRQFSDDSDAAAVPQRASEMTAILDDKSGVLLTALGGKTSDMANEITRITEQTVKAIEAKGFTFTHTMMDNSEQIARIINEASDVATGSVNKSIKQMQSTSLEARTFTPAA